ncbi:BTAD domain-containing putative transcriptional regulator [Dactylosporangium fulvum]
MQIGLLGPLEVRDGHGTPVEVGGARLRVLLTLLALDPGRVVTSAWLVDGVWGDTPPAGAANALQSLVSRLRRVLPDGVLRARPAGYVLEVDPQDVDHLRFEALVAQARREADPAAAVALFKEAEALWRGPAFADAPLLLSRRAKLDEQRRAAVEDRIEAELAIGGPAGGDAIVAELEALVAADPLRERPVLLLMRALRRAGRTAEALAAFERCRVRLADELGADPSPALADLHVDILRDDQPVAGNLRAPLTSFVGRDREVRAVGDLVTAHRLVTLVGPGGAGKTRLSVEAGRVLCDALPDGVWLVELAPVTDPDEVTQAVWAALGMRDPAGTAGAIMAVHRDTSDSAGRLAAALAHRDLLLVLDNCEHVVETAAALADRLLGACAGLRVLATSREPLSITGEVLFPVEPLPLPPVEAGPATAREFPAVRLFQDRAAAVRPGLTADPATVEAAVRICRALDGMPLAIELAAARCRSLTPAQIADRLDDRFRLLTRGSRTALPRHQTLRAVVDWSWDLLDAAERAMLRRLAIFLGGATLESTAAVCDPDGVLGDPLELLTTLVDKSLLTVDGAGRYRMLETIRAYGLERLGAAGETAELRARHAAYFFALTEMLEGVLRTDRQLEALGVLTAEHDNLHGALRRVIADGNADLAVRFVAVVGWYWWLGGHRAEGAGLATAALSLPGPSDPEQRALACGVAAVNGFDGLGETALMREWFQEALAHPATHPMLRLFQALAVLVHRGPTLEVLTQLGTLTEDPDPWIASLGRLLVGHTLLNAGGRFDAAAAEFTLSLDGFRRLGERWGMSFALAALAEVVARQGRHGEAVDHFEEALRYLRDLGVTEDRSITEVRLAQEYSLLGRHEQAEATLADARRTASHTGLPDSLAFVEYAYAEQALRAGDLDQARTRLARAASHAGDRRVSPQVLALVRSGQALVLAFDGDHGTARTVAREAATLACGAFDAPVAAAVLEDTAQAALLAGDPARAATLLAAADTLRGGPDATRPWVADAAAEARAVLDDAAVTAATARGRAVTLGNVRDFFGSDVENPSPATTYRHD